MCIRDRFLNRIDEIIAFNQLTEADFRRISTIMLGELRDTLSDKGIRLTWDDSLLDWLTKKSFSIKFGARNLRRLIEKEIENPLATAIVTGDRPLTGAYLRASEGKKMCIRDRPRRADAGIGAVLSRQLRGRLDKRSKSVIIKAEEALPTDGGPQLRLISQK